MTNAPTPVETSRRATLSRDISERTGITEAMITELVTTFYARVRTDPMLAPVFARVQDWDTHLAHLRAVWSSVTLMSGRYHGQPMQVHMALQIAPAHFDRWLLLFEQAADEIFPPPAAAIFRDKARRIADSFEAAIATQRGELSTPRHTTPGQAVAQTGRDKPI
jgi:hemoglobin